MLQLFWDVIEGYSHVLTCSIGVGGKQSPDSTQSTADAIEGVSKSMIWNAGAKNELHTGYARTGHAH